jgi:phospholipase C
MTTASASATGSGPAPHATPHAAKLKKAPGALPGGYKHLVVIYEENHSFDNLYGHWGEVNGEPTAGLDQATEASTTQVAQDGTPTSASSRTT